MRLIAYAGRYVRRTTGEAHLCMIYCACNYFRTVLEVLTPVCSIQWLYDANYEIIVWFVALRAAYLLRPYFGRLKVQMPALTIGGK